MAPKQNATVTQLASDGRSTTPNPRDSSAQADKHGVSDEVLGKIQKMFHKAQHENANQSEAQAAALLASRMMTRFNITEAEVMQHESSEDRKKRGGMSVVIITPPKDLKRAFFQTWTSDLCTAICTFFDCDAFSTQRTYEIEWTFYGITENTCSGAMAFAMVHNLALAWADTYPTVSKRNSYCLGIMLGLCRIAEEESAEVERKARNKEKEAMAANIREEELHRQKELSRLHDPVLVRTTSLSSTNAKPTSLPSFSAADIPEGPVLDQKTPPQCLLSQESGDLQITPPHGPLPISHTLIAKTTGAVKIEDDEAGIGPASEAHCEVENETQANIKKDISPKGEDDDVVFDRIPDYEGPTFTEHGDHDTATSLTGNTATDVNHLTHAQGMAHINAEDEDDDAEDSTHNASRAEGGYTSESVTSLEAQFELDPSPALPVSPPLSLTAALPHAEMEDAIKAVQKEHNLSEADLSAEWASMHQLTVFREEAKVIGKDVLKSYNIKLVSSRKRKRSVKEPEAYRQGWKDSKKINVRIAAIEDKTSS